MKATTVALTKDGPELSQIIAGAWRWENHTPQELANLIEKSVEVGITTFDHADIYGGHTCENIFGEAFQQTSLSRDQVQLISKCGIILPSPQRPAYTLHHYDTSKEHIISSAENSLKALQTDYLDVLLIHRPDPLMSPDEIAEAFTQLQQQGKVRYFGVSNFTTQQFEMVHSRFPLVTNQIEISLLNLSSFLNGTLDQCQLYSIRPMAWSPFGGGRLFTKHPDPHTAAARVQTILQKISAHYGDVGHDAIALAWLMKHPAGILPILGTGKSERIIEAVKSLEITISREDWFQLWIASTGVPVP